MNDVFLIISAYVWIRNNPSSDFMSVFFRSCFKSCRESVFKIHFVRGPNSFNSPLNPESIRLYLSRLGQHRRQNRSPAERLCTVHTSRTDSDSRVLLLQLRLAGFAFSVFPSGVTETLERVLPLDVLLQETK